MRRPAKFWASGSLVALAAFAAVGCETSGLSPHEQGQQTYPMMMYAASGFDPADAGGGNGAAPTTRPVPISGPIVAAVAQMGELAPPQAMLEKFRGHPELFRRVSTVPAVFQDAEYPRTVTVATSDGTYANIPAARPTAADNLRHLRNMANAVGADYLLVFGGSINHGRRGSGLSLLDLTIVGAYVVPSNGVRVSGKAAGSLIDLRTGQIVMNYSCESSGEGMVPSAFAEGVEERSLAKNRDELVGKLADDVVAQMTTEMRANVANTR